MRERYEGAHTFSEYLDVVQKNRDFWIDVYQRAEIPAEAVLALNALPIPVHALALSEDWCGDAVQAIPLVARLAEASPMLDLRILTREGNPDLMEAHLTRGRSRSIPIVIFYDDDFRELGWWGPRPRILQLWVMEEGMGLPKEDRYRQIRRWYARDGGRTTIREVVELIERVAKVGGERSGHAP